MKKAVHQSIYLFSEYSGVFRILRTLKIVRNNAEFSENRKLCDFGDAKHVGVFYSCGSCSWQFSAILGVQLFAARESFDEERLSFKNFGSALITLFCSVNW